MTQRDRQRRGTTELMGRRLWRERLLAGLSRKDIGDCLAVGAEEIGRYERGERRITPPELALVAERLGVPLALFCPFEEDGADAGDLAPIERLRRLSVPRPLTLLSTPGFTRVRPLFELWRRTGGVLGDEVHRAIRASGLDHRMVLVRNPAGSSRLVTQHFGAGIRTMRPCESLLALERDFLTHHVDGDYAAWVAEAYAETLWRRRPRLESIRALVRVGTAATLSGRYDRLVMPWRSDASDCFAMALSIQRAAPVLSS